MIVIKILSLMNIPFSTVHQRKLVQIGLVELTTKLKMIRNFWQKQQKR